MTEVLPAVEARNLSNALNEVKRMAKMHIREECALGNYCTTFSILDEGIIETIKAVFTGLDYDVVIEEITLNGRDLLRIQLSWAE